MTPMIAAVFEKFLFVEVESLGSLVAEVRSEERNMRKGGLLETRGQGFMGRR